MNQGTNGPSVEAVTALNAHKSTREKCMQRNLGKPSMNVAVQRLRHICLQKRSSPCTSGPSMDAVMVLNADQYHTRGYHARNQGRTLERHSMQKRMYKREGRAIILDECTMKRANVSTEGVGFVECRGRSPISFLCRRSIQTGYVSSTNKNAWTMPVQF